MGMFSWYSRFHWRLFNGLTRLFGIMAMVVAAVAGGEGIYYAIFPRAAEGIETAGFPASAISLLLAAFLAAIGVAMLRVRPYRPDLGDAAWTLTMRRSGALTDTQESHSRSWWTGEPRTRVPSGTANSLLPALQTALVFLLIMGIGGPLLFLALDWPLTRQLFVGVSLCLVCAAGLAWRIGRNLRREPR